MKEEIILIGGGGHCKSCIDVIEQEGRFSISGIVDITSRLHDKVLDYEIIATDEDLPGLVKDFSFFLITLGQIRTATKRRHLFNRLLKMGAHLPTIVSPFAYVSRYASIGQGTIVMHQALVNAGAHVGHNCIINTKALIEHDAAIEDHCHIATAAVVNGCVKVKAGTFLGSNSVTVGCIEVGEKTFINCGNRVRTNLAPGKVIR